MKIQIHKLLMFFMVLGCAVGPWAGKAKAADTSIVYRLKWIENMSTVGDLYAQKQGFFEDQGLKVTVKAGGPERDAIRELELGYAHFGVASADQVIRALSKGAPVVVVAQLFQVNPLQWIYRPDRLSIRQLSDLKGRTLGVTFGKNDEIIMRTLLSRANIRDDEVRLFSVRLDYTPFFKGLVDLWPVYINTQGVELDARFRAAGEQIKFFNPNDYGVQFVANSVVTSEEMVKRHPDTVKRFLRALLKGWGDALNPANRERSLSVVQLYDRDSTPMVLERQLQVTRKLVQPGDRPMIGAFDRAAWQQTEDIMLKYHQIPKPVFVVKRLYDAVTP